MKKIIMLIAVVLVVTGFAVYLAKYQNTIPGTTQAPQNNFSSAPSDPQLITNMQKAGLEQLTAEGTVLHIHQHLDITVNGTPLGVPASIGVASAFISPMHSHDTSGVLHVESPTEKDFKLGQFFEEWGVVFNDSCIGTNCADSTHKLLVAVNGQPISDVANHILKTHEEIEVWYGLKTDNPTWKKSYSFSAGE